MSECWRRQRLWAGWGLPHFVALVTAFWVTVDVEPARAELGRFDAYDIRVIRPRYMTKRSRIELGGETLLIMNQSFIYTLMASGILDYHFSEMFALEVGGAYGFSIDKEDKRLLKHEFDIETQILRTQYFLNGGLLWTPIYGKTQLPSGQLIYFDSFLTLQGGMTGVEYNYEQCATPDDPDIAAQVPDKPAARTKSYPTVVLGFGQKYFTSRDFGLRWDVRDYFIPSYPKVDGSCDVDQPGADQGQGYHNNITLQLGAGTFF